MFDLLKKKISSFIGGLVKKEEEKPAAQAPTAEAAAQAQMPAPEPVTITPEKAQRAPEEARKPKLAEVPSLALPEEPAEARPELPAPAERPLQERKEKPAQKPAEVQPKAEAQQPQKPEAPRELPKPTETPAPIAAPKISILSRVKSLLSSEVEIAERDVSPLLQELELSLLESDVSQETAQFLVEDLRKRLVGKRVGKARLGEEVRGEVARALADVFPQLRSDVAAIARKAKAEGRPAVILFVGPNGTGKTTLIAKLASNLRGQGIAVVLAAADTFRKGAVEQIQEHGRRLGVPVVSRGYEADPTSVAFDAVQHAKANGMDAVLVDTAGRQETSTNLVREMEKMNRVLKPDMRIFVGEAIAGQALVEQVKRFNQAIGLDGLVLTKLDCDAKGGGALTIAHETGLPIMYMGTGQEYSDFMAFDPREFAQRLVGAAS